MKNKKIKEKLNKKNKYNFNILLFKIKKLLI